MIRVPRPRALATSLDHTWAVALLLTLLAGLPRLIRPDLAEYKLDEATAVLNGLAILQHHTLPVQGQDSSLSGAAQGPLFYYLVAFFLAIRNDPRVVVLAIGLANALAVGLAYLVVSRAFNRRIALIASLLYAGSSWSIVFSRKIWPNDLLAPLAVVALWGVLRAIDPSTKSPGLGRAWLAAAAMGSLNLSGWPVALVVALVQVIVPGSRRGQALRYSAAGLGAFFVAAAIEIRTLALIAADLTSARGQTLTFDFSPLSYIVQLVQPDAFQIMAGPDGAFLGDLSQSSWLVPLLRVALLLGVAVAIGRSLLTWRRLGRFHATPELVIVLWWLVPALAALYRPIPVYIHHFLETMPCQFIFVALTIDWFLNVGEWLPIRRHLKQPWTLPSGLVWRRIRGYASGLGVAFAALVFLLQVRAFAAYLPFIQSHPTDTFFGVPLGASLAAARGVQSSANAGPVYVLSDGDLVGVDDVPTVIASLYRGNSIQYVDAEHTIVFPAGASATYLVAPDTVDDLVDALAPWQAPVRLLSRLSPLMGGFELLHGMPIGQALPDGWRRLAVTMEDQAIVVGYSVPRQIHPADTYEVDVLWRVGNSDPEPQRESVFAHLVDDAGRVYAGDDAAPLPTSAWIPGEGILSRFHLSVPPDLPSGRYWVVFGRYRRPGVQPVRFVDAAGRDGPDSLRLGPVVYPPAVSSPRDLISASAIFGQQIALDGWIARQKGDVLSVGVLWQSITPPGDDYTVFVHVVGPNGNLVAQNDGEPVDGQYPTSTWEPGDRIFDVHQIDVGDVAPGKYRIVVGLYTLADGRRLSVGTSDADVLGEIQIPKSAAG